MCDGEAGWSMKDTKQILDQSRDHPTSRPDAGIWDPGVI